MSACGTAFWFHSGIWPAGENQVSMESWSQTVDPIDEIEVSAQSWIGGFYPYLVVDRRENDTFAYALLFAPAGPGQPFRQDGDHLVFDRDPCYIGGEAAAFGSTSAQYYTGW